jgi:excisionase family DNA binding protein
VLEGSEATRGCGGKVGVAGWTPVAGGDRRATGSRPGAVEASLKQKGARAVARAGLGDHELVGRLARLRVIYPESPPLRPVSMNTMTTPISTRPRLTREDVLDGRDVAELLHLPVSTVLEYARRGLLPGHKLGRRWIFLRDEIEVAVRSRPGERSAA